MISRRRLGSVAAVAFAALIVTACGGDSEPADGNGDGDEFTGQGFEECLENPNNCNSGERAEGGSISWIVQTTAQGWLAISPDHGTVYTLQALHGILPHTGHFEPDGVEYRYNMDLLAEEPELLSEDPFTYQFRIRDEAVWDDGTPISADDFAILWRMSASPDEGLCEGCVSRSSSAFDKIESIEGSDDGKTVTITLKPGERNPEWFSYGNADSITGGLPPAHLAEQQGWDVNDPQDLGEYFAWLHETRPEYSGGPYRIVDGDLENEVIKEPNENWYGEVQPTFDTLITRFLTDQGSWVPAVANGEVHGGNPIQLNQDLIDQFRDMPNVMVNIGPGPSWENLTMNLDTPALGDEALRRAIFTAVDTTDIVERNFGDLYPDYTLRTNHVFPERSPHHVDLLEGTGFGTGDLEAARAILSDAGYDWGADGALQLEGEPVDALRLRATADPARVTSMELIQAQLAELGIEIIIETTDNLGGMLLEQDFDIAQFGWSGSPLFAVAPAQYWATDSTSNWGRYSNPEVDELGSQVLNAASQEEAAELANQAAAHVVEDAYVLPLYDTPVYLFVTDDYINVRDNQATSLRALYDNHAWGLVAE